MEKLYRKLQSQGGSTVVSLPSSWIDKFNLKKKDTVVIEVMNDGSLKIRPGFNSSTEQEERDELILNSNPYIVKEVVMNILSGETNIVIVSDKEINKSLKNQIRYWVNGLPNTEITEETKQRIVIQNFGYKKIPTSKIIQRLLYLIEDMFKDVKGEAYDDLNYNFDQLRKFYFILVMHIRAYLKTGVYVTGDSDFTPLEAMDYRIFCGKVEEIGKILKRLRLTPIVIPYFDEIHQYYKDVMDAYLKQDSKVSYFLWLKKYQLLEKADYLLDIFEDKDHDKIKDMIGIAERCKDMAGLF